MTTQTSDEAKLAELESLLGRIITLQGSLGHPNIVGPDGKRLGAKPYGRWRAKVIRELGEVTLKYRNLKKELG